VWADEATPFTGLEVLALLKENQRFRDALEKIEGGDGCYTPSYGDCCDMRCATVAREALAVPDDDDERDPVNGQLVSARMAVPSNTNPTNGSNG
jgi:hypothetical protein